jgi:hypothetical protein
MTQKKSALAQHLATLLKDGTDVKELEKWTVQKLHYEIQKIEEAEAAAKEPETPEEPVAPEPPKKKTKNLLQIILGDSSDDDE